MKKTILIFMGLLISVAVSLGQAAGEKMLYVIDSIPLINDAEDWNPISNEDIADFSVVTNKDSLKQLGWSDLAGVTYVFTKGYRARPDSLKRIPSLKQMVLKNERWFFKDTAYSGRYIDYYNSGKIQNEGLLQEGLLDGKLIIYFKTGAVKSVSDYKNGLIHGFLLQYYKNGALMSKTGYVRGMGNGVFENFFMNSQAESQRKLKQGTRYDSIVNYYSTGDIRQIRLVKNGTVIRAKRDNDISYYGTMFLQSWNVGDRKEMQKNFYHLWLLDSSNITTLFYQGIVLAKEFHFDEAIASFDRVLKLEPLDRNSLLQRAQTRLKKYQFNRSVSSVTDKKEVPLTLEDLMSIPEVERREVCHDLLLADELDPIDYFIKKAVPETILNYCNGKR